MEKKMRKALDNLTEQDGYHNEDVRLTYIESVVSSFKKGIYPTGQLKRMERLINKHNHINEMKRKIKKG
jgi:hypothetical protein|tara:strand:+ start:1331 stop:1537 length:207 start_codon:yes stop_codon:yes gene_type:complete